MWVAWETRERFGIWVRMPDSLATVHSAAADKLEALQELNYDSSRAGAVGMHSAGVGATGAAEGERAAAAGGAAARHAGASAGCCALEGASFYTMVQHC